MAFDGEVLIDGPCKVRHLRIRFVKSRTGRCEGLTLVVGRKIPAATAAEIRQRPARRLFPERSGVGDRIFTLTEDFRRTLFFFGLRSELDRGSHSGQDVWCADYDKPPMAARLHINHTPAATSSPPFAASTTMPSTRHLI